jgi:hypothetical protein
MNTVVELPSGRLIEPDHVEFNLRISGRQHDELIMAGNAQFNRAMADVVNENIVGGGAYQLPLADVSTLWLMARAATLGSDIRSPWVCRHMVERVVDGQVIKAECSYENYYEANIDSLGYKTIPANQTSYKRHSVEVEGSKVEVYSRYLTTREEFEVLDYFMEKGYSAESMIKDETALFQYFKRRWLYSLVIDDSRFSHVVLPEDKAQWIEQYEISAGVVRDMYRDLKELDSVGYDLRVRKVVCKGCGATTALQIPFSAGILV